MSGRWGAVWKSERFAAVARSAFDDAVLGASSVTTGAASLPALRAFVAEWEVSREIVVAVSTLTYAIGATNDDVALERVAGAVSAIGIAGTDDCAVLDCELRAGDSSRRDEECSSVLHFDCIQDRVFKRQKQERVFVGCWSD